MLDTVSYKVSMDNRYARECARTLSIYREAVDFVIPVVMGHWDELEAITYIDKHGKEKPDPKGRQGYVENLIHKKGKNIPRYKFDDRFKNYPSYLRRATITAAIGMVSSYKSNYRDWEENGKNGSEPGYPKAGFAYPCFYRSGMYKEATKTDVRIKVFLNNYWDWVDVKLKRPEVAYLLKHCKDKKQSAPTLRKDGKKWCLQFTFESKGIDLHTTPVLEQRILAVDLGINSACACSVMTADGTVAGREFLRLPAEEDRLTHAMNRLKKQQQRGELPPAQALGEGERPEYGHQP